MAIKQGGGRPAGGGYRLANGARVPSVTTVLGRFKEAGGLVHWAWQLGIDGKDYRKVRDEAAGAGNIAHDLIEADILEREPTLPTPEHLKMTAQEYADAVKLAESSLGAFRDWRSSVHLEVLHTELPLISERHRYGGTIDAIARVGNGLALFDWKSSKRIYADYVIQVSAYRQLWEENHPDEPIESIHLVRVGKEFGEFSHHSWPKPVMDTGWRAFALYREAYDIDALLKRVAA